MKRSFLFEKTLFSPSITILILLLCVFSAGAAAVVTGELKKWHTVTVTFDGPAASESDTATFLNNRLNVTFTNGSKSYIVPGFFTADGNAAVSGATSGSKWRVHFCPDTTGTWTYTASFRTGTNVAIDPSATAGTADATIDGLTGTLTIGATDKTGADLRGKGMLRYVKKHYLQFAETGQWYIKDGCNSPDNFFAFADFDNTPAVHSYTPHVADWTAEDSLWGGKGKGIIGAINYLSSVGLNSQCVRVLNRPGETGDVFPYVDSGSAPWSDPAVLKKFDCSKLDQWEIVFEQMTKKGLHINISMSQPGNASSFEFAEGLLSSADPFAATRKLFYREMVARFGHHCALTWTIIEATYSFNLLNTDQTKSLSGQQMVNFGAYLHSIDPYQHPVACGTELMDWNPTYMPYLNGDTLGSINCISIVNDMHSAYEYPNYYWRQRTKTPYICFQDQVSGGVPYSADSATADSLAAYWGIEVFWPHLLQGGSGVEMSLENQGRKVENFRDFRLLWKQVAIAARFISGLPLQSMFPGDFQLTSGQTRYPYLQLGKDSLFIVKINSNFLKTFAMDDTTRFKAGEKFKILWFSPTTGTYAKGSVDSFVVSDLAVEAHVQSFGVPPGITPDTLWTQGKSYPYTVQWICILRNASYSNAVIKPRAAGAAYSMLRVAGARVCFTVPGKNERVRLSLLSINGAEIKTVFDGRPGAGEHWVSIESSHLAAGVYFVHMQQGAKSYAVPFVKVK